MKKIIIALLFVNTVAQAQKPTLGLNIQTVYTGIKMPLLFNPGCNNINNINFQVENGDIVKEENAYYLIAKSNGMVSVKIKEGNNMLANYNFISKPMPVLDITVGNISSKKIQASIFNLQTGLKCVLPDFLHEDDYKVISATVYFSGTNFKDIAVTTITNSFNSMQSYLDKCDVGTIITFDNVRVQGPTGIMSTNGLSIALY